jgi:hypothetical protein
VEVEGSTGSCFSPYSKTWSKPKQIAKAYRSKGAFMLTSKRQMTILPELMAALVMACCCSASALAQPVQLPPAITAPVGDLLASAPDVVIGNGMITAHVARIDAARGFYNGTRFDQAGVVTSLTLNGREFYGPWFERVASNADSIL